MDIVKMNKSPFDAVNSHRMSTRASSKEADVRHRGTSSQSPNLAQRSLSTEGPYFTDESTGSSDSGSPDSEQIGKEIKKKQKFKSQARLHSSQTQPSEVQNIWKHNASSGLYNEAIKDSTHTQASEILVRNSKKHKTSSGLYNELKKGSVHAQPSEVQSSRKCNTNSGSCKEATEGSAYTLLFVLTSVFILSAVIIGCYLLSNNHPNLEARKLQLKDTFIEIRKQFPTQEDGLWVTLFAGIKKVEEEDPSQPSTFLLLHEAEEDATPKCLAVKMSKAATAFLEAADPSPLKLRGEELGVNDSLIKDHGVLISEQKENITNHRAVIVFNLHKIPASVAQSFHYFCDEYHPVVQKAVYFFTMSVSKKLHSSPTYVAESELRKLWRQQLENDKLQPLIVRLTTSVIMIKPEEGLTSSCDS